MGITQIYIMSLGLAMDAFTVSITKGLSMKMMSWKYAIIVALYFGIFQGFMPLIGYSLGVKFEPLIVSIDHWIAFILLSYLGYNMIQAAREKNMVETVLVEENFSVKAMIPLAIATSIDALAVGITLAFLNVNILFATFCIGLITFLCCLVGVKIGHTFGIKYKQKAELFGGFLLIWIGLNILIEHLTS